MTNVVLSSLLHFEGADTSTTFTDVSGKVWTPAGNAQIDTAQFKFGSASGLFDGTGDYLTTPEHADFDFGSGDFTIECFVRFNALPAGSAIIRKSSGANIGWLVLQTATTTLNLYASSNGTSWNICSAKVVGTGLTTGTWYHVAISRTGSTWNAWINGALGTGSTFPLTSAAALSNYPAAGPVPVAVGSDGAGAVTLNGWIDDLRVINGYGLYPAAFTPPTVTLGAVVGFANLTLPLKILNFEDGKADLTLPMKTLDAQGVHGTVSNSDLTLPSKTLSASGLTGFVGNAELTLPMKTLEALGGDSTDIVLPMKTLDARGVTGVVGRAALILPAKIVSGTGFASVVGTADNTLPMKTLDASGLVGVIGNATITLPAKQLSASGLTGIVGNASIVLPMIELSAKGYGPITGTADLTLPMKWVSAFGTVAISDHFRTWAVNMRNRATTEYRDIVFNSFAVFQGNTYGASVSGIYPLGMQDTDAGAAISATLRTGKSDYASSFLKRIPRLYVNGEFSGAMNFKVITTEQGENVYTLADHGYGLRSCRVVLGKGLKSRDYQFEVSNVAGAYFSLNSIAAYPAVLRRRVQSA